MNEDEMYDIICGYEDSERDYHERNIELEAENAKLRELVRIMYYCNLPWKNCDKCAMNGADMDLQISDIEFCDELNDLMRELGIEVDE